MGLGVLIGVVLTIAGLPGHLLNPDALADFDRLQRHIGRDVVVVDATGLVLEGRVIAATSTSLDVGFGQHLRSFSPEAIARVDRQVDSPLDGLIKGLIVGALLGSMARDAKWTLSMAAGYGGLGLALDVGHRAREPIYRAPDPKAVKIQAAIRW
jgi:hypothetical protein